MNLKVQRHPTVCYTWNQNWSRGRKKEIWNIPISCSHVDYTVYTEKPIMGTKITNWHRGPKTNVSQGPRWSVAWIITRIRISKRGLPRNLHFQSANSWKQQQHGRETCAQKYEKCEINDGTGCELTSARWISDASECHWERISAIHISIGFHIFMENYHQRYRSAEVRPHPSPHTLNCILFFLELADSYPNR